MSAEREARPKAAWRYWPAACAALVVGAAGWFIGRAPASTPTDRPETSLGPAASRGTHALPRLRDRSSRQPPGFDDQLTAIRKQLGPSATPDEVMVLLEEIAASDPALAIDLADALGQTEEEKTAWITDLAEQWARLQPQQAWDWLSAQQPSRLVDLATGTVPETVIGTLAEAHPNQLLGNLDRLVHAGESDLGVPPVVAVHLGLDALAASNRPDLTRRAVETWTHAAGRPSIGESAYLTAALAMTDSSPDHAGAWLQSLPVSEERDTALVEFPAHWAEKHPRAAVEWAAANLPPDLRLPGLRRALSEWFDRNPADAVAWLTAHLASAPASADTDQLLALLKFAGRPPAED